MTEEIAEKSQEGVPPNLAGPLPIWPILRDAVLIPWERRGHFGRLMILPLVCTTFLEHAWLTWLEDYDPSKISGYLYVFFLYIPLLFLLTVYAVGCHRSILVGDHTVPRFGIKSWTGRETRFFLWPILMMFVAFSITGIVLILSWFLVGMITMIIRLFTEVPYDNYFSLLFTSLAGIGFILFSYFWGRFSLVLPATAIDLNPDITSVWNQSNGNGLRVAFVVCIIPWITSYYFHDFFDGIGTQEGIVELVIRNFFLFLVTTFEITVLSFTYKELSWWNSPKFEKG